MNHDISHCDGVNCKNANTCNRAIAYKEAMLLNLTYFSLIKPTERPCDLYWPINKIKK